MNTTQSNSIPGTCIRLTISDNLVHEIIDFGSSESVSRAVAQPTQGFTSYVTDARIWKDDEELETVSKSETN